MNHSRATYWQTAGRKIQFGTLPVLMGIVNVTPDSFSDGGRFYAADAAVDQATQLAAAGAGIIDIGGESTRPYSDPVDAAEEARRVVPVIERLASTTDAVISIDTSKASVARAALAAGAGIINDVTAFTGDAEMTPLALETGAGVCIMHMQGTPQTMQDDPSYSNVTQEICDYLEQRRNALLAAGIEADRICIDPGIGFGKTHQHNLQLLQECEAFHRLGAPVLVGHSRKGFIGKIARDKEADRDPGTIGVALSLARQGVQVIRVHNVAATMQALQLFEAAGGLQ